MKKLLLGLLGLAATMSAMAESREIVSPSGGLKVCVSDDGGKAAYSVSLNGATCIETSPLGIVLNFADYTSGLKMAQVRRKERWMWNIRSAISSARM